MDMTFMLAAYSAAGVTLLLIAGGWVTVREYFKRKAAEKQAEIDALVEKRMARDAALNSKLQEKREQLEKLIAKYPELDSLIS
ncbi:hypothetical protein SNN83_002713 [Cronobacter malonaticus]|nr:hypothetical protein [Cronobacter malonaticus]